MITGIIEFLGSIAHGMINTLGYPGIVLGMAIESINIPLPSEALMTFSGALVAEGRFTFWAVVTAGAVGNVIGSVGNYYLGAYGGRPFVEKYGKYVLVRPKELEAADRWFAKYGLAAVFLTRLLPIIRTFISFPAGVARVPLLPFIVLTFVGSFIWSAGLTYVGYEFGKNYDTVFKPYLQKFEIVVALLLVIGIVWYVRRHFRHIKNHD